MSKPFANINFTTATFETVFTLVDQIAFLLSTEAMTANSTTANNTGNAQLFGSFGANTIYVTNGISGGNIGNPTVLPIASAVNVSGNISAGDPTSIHTFNGNVIFFNASGNNLIVTSNGTFGNIVVTNISSGNGSFSNISSNGNINATNLNVSANITSNGILIFGSNSVITGNITSNGNANLVNLNASGNGSFSNINVSSNGVFASVTVSSNINAGNSSSQHNINGLINANNINANNIVINNNLSVNNTLQVSTLISNTVANLVNLNVSGNSNFTGNINATSINATGLIVNGNISTTGNVAITKNLTVSGNVIVTQNLISNNVSTGTVVADSIIIQSNSSTNTLTIFANGSIFSVGNATLLGTLNCDGVNVSGVSNFGFWNIDNPTILGPQEFIIKENVNGAQTLDFDNSTNYKLNLQANVTFTFTTGAGFSQSTLLHIKMLLVQAGGGNRHVTWPAGTLWAGGVAPTLSTGANQSDMIQLTSFDGGNSYVGVMLASNVA